MTTRNQNFEMFSGDSKDIVVTVTGVDLAGASIKWLLHKFGNPVVTKSTANGVTIADATGGKFTVRLAPVDTQDLVGEYSQEAEVTDASGNVSTVMTGTVKIEKGFI